MSESEGRMVVCACRCPCMDMYSCRIDKSRLPNCCTSGGVMMRPRHVETPPKNVLHMRLCHLGYPYDTFAVQLLPIRFVHERLPDSWKSGTSWPCQEKPRRKECEHKEAPNHFLILSTSYTSAVKRKWRPLDCTLDCIRFIFITFHNLLAQTCSSNNTHPLCQQQSILYILTHLTRDQTTEQKNC